MRGSGERWKLDELIDFEVALGAWDGASRPESLPPSGSRGVLFKAWKNHEGSSGHGKKWLKSFRLAALLYSVLFLAAGFGAGWGLFDRQREGVNVVIFLWVTLFVPWLFFLAGGILWVFRPRWTGWLGMLLKEVIVKFSGAKGRDVAACIAGNPELAKAIGWRIAGKVQSSVADFHLGAILALCTMMMFHRVGFYWATTTERAMQRVVEAGVEFLSLPWAWVGGEFLPDVAGTRRWAGWDGGGEEWAIFLMLALSFWGFLPRGMLGIFSSLQERRVLKSPAFESPRHRKLWRVLTGVRRGEDPAGPADGALVIDLGGVRVDRDFLRPFFLRRLRLNPVAWETTGVLDAGREASARGALAKAPAGVILLAEGWSLAPRQVEDILRRALDTAEERRIVLYVADFDGEGRPREAGGAEREAWAAFADGLAGVEVELIFHEEERTWAPG